MRLHLIRRATLQIEMADRTILLDPMLAAPYSYRSLTIGQLVSQNPTVPLPCKLETLLQPDAVLVTHLHFDHFDQVAAARLS